MWECVNEFYGYLPTKIMFIYVLKMSLMKKIFIIANFLSWDVAKCDAAAIRRLPPHVIVEKAVVNCFLLIVSLCS